MSKLEQFQAKARELAQSSNFYGWPPLEFELRFEDEYSEAREWLYLPSTRDELDRICQAARKRREAVRQPLPPGASARNRKRLAQPSLGVNEITELRLFYEASDKTPCV